MGFIAGGVIGMMIGSISGATIMVLCVANKDDRKKCVRFM